MNDLSLLVAFPLVCMPAAAVITNHKTKIIFMKVLLTGASGFLGQHFLHSLIQKIEDNDDVSICAIYGSMEGFEEEVISRKDTPRTDCLSSVLIQKLDLTSAADIDEFFDSQTSPFDICFHLAALSSPKVCNDEPQKAKSINVPSHFLEKLKDTPMIALSTDQVYDGKTADLYEESDPIGPLNVYSQTKLDLESLLLSDEMKRSKPTICLRSSIILGPLAPYGKAHSTFLHFCQSREGQETTFFTDEIRSVIDVNDVVHVLLHFYKSLQDGVLDEMSSGVYNMGGSEPVSRIDIAFAVAEQFNFKDYDNYFIPVEKAKLTPKIGEVVSPLDISMTSSKLEEMVGFKIQGLARIVERAF